MSTSSLVPSLLLRHVLLSRKLSARLSPPLFTECISANESHLLPDGCVSFQISLYLGQEFSRGFLFPTPSFFYLRSSRNRPVCTSFSFLLMFFHVLFILFSYPFQTLFKPFLNPFYTLFIPFLYPLTLFPFTVYLRCHSGYPWQCPEEEESRVNMLTTGLRSNTSIVFNVSYDRVASSRSHSVVV